MRKQSPIGKKLASKSIDLTLIQANEVVSSGSFDVAGHMEQENHQSLGVIATMAAGLCIFTKTPLLIESAQFEVQNELIFAKLDLAPSYPTSAGAI